MRQRRRLDAECDADACAGAALQRHGARWAGAEDPASFMRAARPWVHVPPDQRSMRRIASGAPWGLERADTFDDGAGAWRRAPWRRARADACADDAAPEREGGAAEPMRRRRRMLGPCLPRDSIDIGGDSDSGATLVLAAPRPDACPDCTAPWRPCPACWAATVALPCPVDAGDETGAA
eukprot:gene3197-4246_t